MTYRLYTVDNKFIKESDSIPDKFTGIVGWESSYKEHLVNGKLHRLDGPAAEYSDGGKTWYNNERIHRIGGPAIERPGGIKKWCIFGKYVSEQEHDLLHSLMELKGLIYI